MKQALIGAACLMFTACGAYTFPGDHASPTPNTGQVSGHVVAVPCAPVEQAGSPCAGRPVSKMEIDYVQGTSVAARTVTDGNGNYAVRLEPGEYTVRFNNSIARVISGPTRITIAAGSSIVANYTLDSGIRVPAPG